MRALYIDVDGCLNKMDGDWSKGPAWRRDAPDFLRWALKHFDCRFLTAWYPRSRIEDECLAPLGLKEQADKFKYPDWKKRKTEGIDFSIPFYWIDDDGWDEDVEELQAHGVEQSLIDVYPKGEEELQKVAKKLADKERTLYGNEIPDLSGKQLGEQAL